MSNKKSSHNQASIAVKVLHDQNAKPPAKRLAASVLIQAKGKYQ